MPTPTNDSAKQLLAVMLAGNLRDLLADFERGEVTPDDLFSSVCHLLEVLGPAMITLDGK